MHGHDVVMFDARPKPGGLNEYGIATYKTPDDFAQAEVDWLLEIGGITLRTGVQMGRDLSLAELREDHDAVFLGLGLAGVNALRAEGEELAHVHDAVDFIADLRQARDRRRIPVGRRVVVIGGGMTAVDAAVQAKLLGAERVTMVYRRTRDRMGASQHELLHAASKGVQVVTGAAPLRLLGDSVVTGVEFAATDSDTGQPRPDDHFRIPADQVFKAIGQRLGPAPGGLDIAGGKIAVTGPGRTALPDVWAGGDCAAGGEDLTVTAVAEGRDAAEDIHARLAGATRIAAE
jgi:glutamate synthase (NADPH/NADH) small chain